MKELPRHIAIIMDGNGRWAKKRRLPRIVGHRSGGKTVDKITEECTRLGIKALTLYAFSTENWKRSQEEIKGLMMLLKDHLIKMEEKIQKNNVKFNVIGRIKDLPEDLQVLIDGLMERTSSNAGLILTLALNYGGRHEIVDAAKNIAVSAINGEIDVEKIDVDTFEKNLYTEGLPELDLIIRTSNEMRLSNFLLWQAAYAEFYFTETLWPDFTEKELKKAIDEYQNRDRRFGA